MILKRLGLILCGLMLLLVSCSKQEREVDDGAEWDAIQPLVAEDDAADSTRSVLSDAAEGQSENTVSDERFAVLQKRLDALKSAKRSAGETLLSGKSMVFDYEQQSIRLKDNVWVEDDRGTLRADLLGGRFTVSNEVEYIEAQGDVVVHSEGREARSDYAEFEYESGLIRMNGHAWVSDGTNRLSGERIQLWIKESRKVICEPNAVLEIKQLGGLELDAGEAQDVSTEIRAGRIVFDEDLRVIHLTDQVRLRDPRVAMNCDTVHLHLKDTNEIDWIEARSGVIIQIQDRKALADRAAYYADEKKMVLEGNPMVKQGRNIMTGDRILFWQETRRMVCEPNARVLLFVDEATRAKFLKDLND